MDLMAPCSVPKGRTRRNFPMPHLPCFGFTLWSGVSMQLLPTGPPTLIKLPHIYFVYSFKTKNIFKNIFKTILIILIKTILKQKKLMWEGWHCWLNPFVFGGRGCQSFTTCQFSLQGGLQIVTVLLRKECPKAKATKSARGFEWLLLPKCSMYGSFTYTYQKFKPNVGK